MTLEANRGVSCKATYWTAIAVFASVQLILSCLTPKLLRDAGATGLHLSLITSGFYTYLVQVLLGKEKVIYPDKLRGNNIHRTLYLN